MNFLQVSLLCVLNAALIRPLPVSQSDSMIDRSGPPVKQQNLPQRSYLDEVTDVSSRNTNFHHDSDFYIPTATLTVVRGFLIGIILSLFITGLTITLVILLTGLFQTNTENFEESMNHALNDKIYDMIKSTFTKGKSTIFNRFFASFSSPAVKYNLRTGLTTFNNHSVVEKPGIPVSRADFCQKFTIFHDCKQIPAQNFRVDEIDFYSFAEPSSFFYKTAISRSARSQKCYEPQWSESSLV